MIKRIALYSVLLQLFLCCACFAADYVDIHTMQLKRLAQAATNIKAGWKMNTDLVTANSVTIAVTSAKTLPGEISKTDYAQMLLLRDDLLTVINKYQSTIDKFMTYDSAAVDPLNFLGRKFYIIGEPE